MIDYDKLKEALAVIEDNLPGLTLEFTLWKSDDRGGDIVFTGTDSKELISKIKELTNEMYKDEYGNWWLEEQLYPSCQALIDAQIEHWMRLKKEETSTCSDDMSMPSTSGYDEIKCSNGSNCEHITDGYSYITQHTPREYAKKCKHCWEFYR